jgi:uncharacterized protein (TIGR02246 family)
MTKDKIKSLMRAQYAAWNGGDRAAWLACFENDVQFEDPVGGAPKRGREHLEETWDRSFTGEQTWTMNPLIMRVSGNEVALLGRNAGVVGGQEIEIDSIEVWTINENGLVARFRAFYDLPEADGLDDFFSHPN